MFAFFLSKQYLHYWVCMKHVYMYQSLYHAISSLQTHMALIKSLHYFEFLFCLKNIILKITIFTRKIIEIFFLSFSDGNIKSCKPIEFSWRKLLKYWRKHAQLVILIDPNPYSLTLKKRKSLSLSLSLSLSHISQTLTLTLTITVFLEISSKNGSKEEDIFNPELARSPWVNELGDFTNAWQRYFQDISKGLQDLPTVK